MNKFVLLIFVSTFLISCQSVKDGLTGVKRNNSDEFLIEKKKSTYTATRVWETTNARKKDRR